MKESFVADPNKREKHPLSLGSRNKHGSGDTALSLSQNSHLSLTATTRAPSMYTLVTLNGEGNGNW